MAVTHAYSPLRHDAINGILTPIMISALVALLTALCIYVVDHGWQWPTVPWRRSKDSFALMKLPSELRLLIFERLIEQEQNHQAPASQASLMGNNMAPRYNLRGQRIRDRGEMSLMELIFKTHKVRAINALPLVNKQMSQEFMAAFARKGLYKFELDASYAQSNPLWNLSAAHVGRIRYCKLVILATPRLVGGFDPRSITGPWDLQDRVFERMALMKQLKVLELSIEACGDELWNPILLWHYTSQRFKESGIKAFGKIGFDLRGWSMRRPNYLARTGAGWQWCCWAGHVIMEDVQGAQPVREFCEALYSDCALCKR